MTTESVAEKAADAVIDYIQGRHVSDDEQVSLSEYMDDWLKDNSAGLLWTGGQPTVYLRTMLHVLHRLSRDPSILDYRGEDGKSPVHRKLSGVFYVDSDGSVDEGCADPEEFRVALFEAHFHHGCPPSGE